MTDAAEKTQHIGSGLGRGKSQITSSVRRPRRHKELRDNIKGITTPAIRRAARRGGVKRLDNKIYEETRARARGFVQKLMRDTCSYVEYARRKTVMLIDVNMSSKKNGVTLYSSGILNTNVGYQKKPAKKSVDQSASIAAPSGAQITSEN